MRHRLHLAFFLVTATWAVCQSPDQRSRTFRIYSVNDGVPVNDVEQAIRRLSPEQAAGPQLVTATDLEPGDVKVKVQVEGAITDLSGRPTRGNDAVRVQYTIVAQRTSDQRSIQQTRATFAGNWQPVSKDILGLVAELYPAGSVTVISALPVLISAAPLTIPQAQALSLPRTYFVRMQDSAINVGT